jgi:hypothetical protein
MGFVPGRPLRAGMVAIATSVLLIVGSLVGGAAAQADDTALAFTTVPTPIISTAVVGSRSSMGPGTWAPMPDSVTYQWFEDGVAIQSSTLGGASYSRFYTPADMGAHITVAVTASKAGYVSQTVTSAPIPVLGEITEQSVAIDGVPKPGETLTADGSFTPSDAMVTYQWIDQNGRWIPGATAQTYVPTEAEAGQRISVNFEVALDGYQTTSYGGFATITYDTLQPPGSLQTSDVHIGAIVVAPRAVNWFPQPTTLTYQWMRDGTDILDATDPVYTVSSEDVGSTLEVRETASMADYPDKTWISPPTTVVLPDFDNVTTPVIVGIPQVGVPVALRESSWTPAAQQEEVEWFVDGVPAGTVGQPFIPTGADIGSTITADVVGWSDSRASAVSPRSAPSAPVIASTYSVGAVTIGRVHLNSSVSVTFRRPPNGATLTYQWFINGAAIPGATAGTYLPEGSTWHKDLSVRVTVSGDGYSASHATSNVQLVRDGYIWESNGIAEIKPGEAVRVGATLHAVSAGTPVAGQRVRFMWAYGPNLKAYGTTFTVPATAYRHTFAVYEEISSPHLTDDGWLGNIYAVGLGRFSSHPTPTITGTAKVGAKLTAHVGSWSPASRVTYTYRWYSKSAPGAASVFINGATRSTLTVPRSLAGRSIAVQVTAHKSRFVSVAETSKFGISVSG